MFKCTKPAKSESQTSAERIAKNNALKDLKVELKAYIKTAVETADVELSDLWKYVKNKYPNQFLDTEVVAIAYDIYDDFNKKEVVK